MLTSLLIYNQRVPQIKHLFKSTYSRINLYWRLVHLFNGVSLVEPTFGRTFLRNTSLRYVLKFLKTRLQTKICLNIDFWVNMVPHSSMKYLVQDLLLKFNIRKVKSSKWVFSSKIKWVDTFWDQLAMRSRFRSTVNPLKT